MDVRNLAMLTREELAEKLGVPEHRLDYSPNGPRMSRRMRRKVVKLMRRKAK